MINLKPIKWPYRIIKAYDLSNDNHKKIILNIIGININPILFKLFIKKIKISLGLSRKILLSTEKRYVSFFLRKKLIQKINDMSYNQITQARNEIFLKEKIKFY